MTLIATPDYPRPPYTLKQYRRFCQLIIDRNGSELFCFLKLIDDNDIEAALWDAVTYSDIDQYGNDARTKTRRGNAFHDWYMVGGEQIRCTIDVINGNFYDGMNEAWRELSTLEKTYVKQHLTPEVLHALEVE